MKKNTNRPQKIDDATLDQATGGFTVDVEGVNAGYFRSGGKAANPPRAGYKQEEGFKQEDG